MVGKSGDIHVFVLLLKIRYCVGDSMELSHVPLLRDVQSATLQRAIIKRLHPLGTFPSVMNHTVWSSKQLSDATVRRHCCVVVVSSLTR